VEIGVIVRGINRGGIVTKVRGYREDIGVEVGLGLIDVIVAAVELRLSPC